MKVSSLASRLKITGAIRRYRKTTILVKSTAPVQNLPDAVHFDGTEPAIRIENLSAAQEGLIEFSFFQDDVLIAEAGPVLIRKGNHAGYWGDLHGQSGETIGIGRIEDYMNFARNKAFLDITCHQGNDFQVKNIFWEHLNQVTAAWNEPHRFTVFPGYEWSGNTVVGGDHNVIYKQENGQLYRCSHALIEDCQDLSTDAHTLTDLYQSLRSSGDEAVVFAHIGGRYANLAYDHDPLLETSVEIHSDWGTFEWIAHDSFALGRRVGIVANSDGHRAAPGQVTPEFLNLVPMAG